MRSFGSRPLSLAALAATLILIALIPSARAAERVRVPSIAIPDSKALGAVDPKSVAALSSLTASEAAHHPVKVLAGSDLQALLGLEKQRQMMGCTDTSCMAQIGGALGVEYLLVTDVGEVGGRWLLTMTLLDVARVVALTRVTKQARTVGDLVDLVPAGIDETLSLPGLARPQPEPARPEVAKPEVKPEPAAAPTPAVHAETKASMSTQKIAGFALIGVGAAAAIGGVAAGAVALKQHSDAKSLPPVDPTALGQTKSNINATLWVADGLFIAAAAIAGTGLVLVLTSPSASAATAPSASVGIAPIYCGGAVVVSGGF